jgi:uncharacterized protein (TIGR03067 family)
MKAAILSCVLAWLFIPVDDAARRELDKYQGTWVLISEELQGEDVPVRKRPKLSCVVKDDKLVFTSNGKERSAFVRLDPGKNPATYDLIRDDGFLSLNGIYVWDGDDVIKICAADQGGDRPAEFKTAAGSPNRIRIWKRKKP